jgi:tetratricopeptide (TPR) repeat protein
MEKVRNYEALIYELLGKVTSDWNYNNLKGWLIFKSLESKELELARWLREHGTALVADEVRMPLVCLAGLGRGELAEVAGELMRGWEPEVDESKEWLDRGNELYGLGKYEEAISSCNKAIEIKPDLHEAWYIRGNVLFNSGRYAEAIVSFDKAIELESDLHEAWYGRGNALVNSGRCEEAVTSYDKAIEIKTDKHEAWYNRGNALDNLGRYAEAIASYNKVIEIVPARHEAWYNRGIALNNLRKWEEAITSYNKAIEIKADKYGAWYNRGIALNNLDKYEEAIASYNKAIEIAPNQHEAWYNRGNALDISGRYAEAIVSYDKAIEFKPDLLEALRQKGIILCDRFGFYKQALECFDQVIKIQSDNYIAWQNRGIAIGNLQGYQPQINSLLQAFEHIHPNIHPESWGFIQREIGRIQYDEGNNQLFNHQRDPKNYYELALNRYKEALKTLTREQFPKLRLETLIDTAKAYLTQKNPSVARDCQTEALTIWQESIDAETSPQGKKRLYLEYSYLLRTQVDLSILTGEPIRALEIAEFDKNKHLEWFLYSQAQQGRVASLILAEIEQMRLNVVGLQYLQMRQLLSPQQAIIYWHLSPENLTTFILHPHQPDPQVLTSRSHQLQTWLRTYDTETLDTANWQELNHILQISEINRHLNGIQHLILIPHRDLHRLPLHSYWTQITTTYLPSIQIGLNLQAKPQPKLESGLLLIESPAYHAATTQKQKDKPLSILPNAEIEAAILEYLLQPKTIIRSGAVSNDRLHTDLNRPHYYGHFNGHAYHDARRPQDSSLILDGDDVLACADLAQIDLQPYHLISLSACQTGVTTHQTIDTEYVGLVSAFLSRGTNYVVSTLWSVADLPSSLLMMAFYMYIKKGIPAPLALRQAASWLRNLTHAKEAEFHGNIYQWLAPNSSTARSIERNRQNAAAAAQDRPEEKPYSNPKYWAAFTISGWG